MPAQRCAHREGARPPVQVPEGCLANQSGEYVHEGNPAYRYRARDDGGTLVLWLEQGPPPDGGPRQALAQAPRVVLERTPEGFAGRTEARTFTASGQSCEVSFPTRVVACLPGGLTLRAAPSAALDELCRAPPETPGGAPRPMVEHRLLRNPLARDGGAG